MRFERFPTLTLLLVSTAILVMGLSMLPALAQTVVNGDISGTVSDAAGAVITVWDSGPGVPQSEFENVFRPFYRPKDAPDRGGTGLGLALVRQIARRHGGDARCKVMDDGRSCFIVTLPA